MLYRFWDKSKDKVVDTFVFPCYNEISSHIFLRERIILNDKAIHKAICEAARI